MAGAGYKLFASGDVLTAAQVNNYLQEQAVMVFASSAARTTALSGVLAEGMITYLTDSNLVQYYDGTSWTSISPATTTIAAAKNVIINGSMDVWQRGTSFTGGQYGADRWTSGSSANTFTVSRVTGLSDFRYALKLNLTGANTFTQIGTQIEFNNCYFLQNQTVTISFWAQANNTNAASTALTVRTRTIAGVDGACIFAGTASDTAVTITTTATRYTITKTLPATFGSLSLEFSMGSGTTNDGFTVTGVQLELGSVASAFTRTGGTIQGELAACQRYYWRMTSPSTGSPLGNAYATSTTAGYAHINYPVEMRTSTGATLDYSTIAFYLPGTAFYGATAATISTSTRLMALLNVTGMTGLTANRPYTFSDNNSTSGYIGISAEL